jgi:Domain of unknown function (DUF4132)
MANDQERLRAALASRLQSLGIAPDDPRFGLALERVQAVVQRGLAVVHDGTIGSADSARPRPAAPTHDGPELPERLRVLLDAYIANVHSAAEARRPEWMNLPVHAVMRALALEAPALSSTEAGRAMLALAPPDRTVIAVHAYARWSGEGFNGHNRKPLQQVVSDILRAKLEVSEAQALALIQAAIRDGFYYTSYTPNHAVARALERYVQANGLSMAARDALVGLRTRMKLKGADTGADGRKLLKIVDSMLATADPVSGAGASVASAPRFLYKPDDWGRHLRERLDRLPFDQRARLTRVLALAAKGGDKSKPTKGWLGEARKELETADRGRIGELLLDLVEAHEPGTALALENECALRGLLWLAGVAAAGSAARRLEAYAQKCLTFSPTHFAYMSLVLGNAAVHAFSLMPGTDGVGSLTRLKRRLKRPGEVKTIEKAIAALAEARGMSPGEIEEIGLPDYGLDTDGRLEVAVGSATAVLAVDASKLSISWLTADRQTVSGPPAAVKDGHAEALKALKATAKEIDETLKAQRLRLERLYLDDRTWPLATWRGRYLEHPLVADLARHLIWSFEIDGRWIAGLAEADGIRDATGAVLPLDNDPVHVRLWHPMQSDTAHVLAWRRRILKLGVTQPFKQAHREIYVVTDAERETEVYSNRFAGHIVTQSQFRALTQARGWKCPAYGAWDNGGGYPLKQLHRHGLQIEYWVDPVEDTMTETYQFRHLATDQVRFARPDGSPIRLDEIDPVVFSELMRDVDLFVGVASIANDPTWADRGEDGAPFGTYWQRAAWGELAESGRTRHAVLADLIPGLSIAGKCRIEERHLVITGKLRTYRIHLGSGNIQMEPENRYLCIVEDRKAERAKVRLPFEGDQTLAIILSKAFMLAADDRIQDKSIVAQIRQGLPGGAA